MHIVMALIVGLLFGTGLLISGMANPAKVLGFLDLAGACDPSLSLVMLGAVAIGLVAFRAAGRRPVSLLGHEIAGLDETVFTRLADAAIARATRVDPAASLESLGIDSLSFIEFMFKVEEEFGVSVSDEDLKSIRTLGDLERHVASALVAAGKA